LAGSLAVLTQRLPHFVVPPEHSSWQVPPEHAKPGEHPLPQLPQLPGSVSVLTQDVPHCVVPPEH
jgi:hypothetical protein